METATNSGQAQEGDIGDGKPGRRYLQHCVGLFSSAHTHVIKKSELILPLVVFTAEPSDQYEVSCTTGS